MPADQAEIERVDQLLPSRHLARPVRLLPLVNLEMAAPTKYTATTQKLVMFSVRLNHSHCTSEPRRRDLSTVKIFLMSVFQCPLAVSASVDASRVKGSLSDCRANRSADKKGQSTTA